MCSHWTEAKLFKFLRLYKHRECLWNPYSPEYGNSDKKSESLSEIIYEMNIFGLTINECLKQIKYLRQTYKEEQRRLERLASLGGRTLSKLLWYPLMNSMLSKVIKDEEKLNRATGTLDLVVASNQVPNNPWYERSHCGALSGTGYRRRSISWARSETTSIFSYPPNLGYGDYVDRCPNRMVANIHSAENEHLGSCPTCGYSSGSSCDCFSIDDYPYNSEIIEQSYNTNSRSQIDYRPRTSYNYRNGILEINSAVRIPVSQPASNCGYGQLMECITQEQPEFRNIEEVEDQSTECCANSFNYNIGNDKLNGCKSTAEPMDVDSYLSNLPINRNGVRVKCRLKKSNRTKRINVDKILCAQNLMGSMSVGPNSICDRFSCAERGSDDTPLIIDEKNLNVYLECPKLNVIVEEESKADVNTTCCGMNLEVSRSSRTEKNISSKICQGKLKGDEDSIESLRSGKTEAIEKSDEHFLQDLIDECNRKKADSKPSEGLVQKSKDVVKRNLTKIVIAYISKILNQPIKRRKIDAGERMILKKVVKDLKLSSRDSGNCVCSKKSISKAETNTDTKSWKKTICWREPIEENLNTVSCRSTKLPAINEVGLPKMIGGADFESRTNKQSSMSDQDTFSKNHESSSATNDCECFSSNNEPGKTGELTPSYLQNVEICEQATKAQSNLNGKNHKEFSDSISSSREIAEIENGVAIIKVSIETSGSTEDEILDKVVNKITDILRQTLYKNGYSIEKKQFLSRELISDEAVWRSELTNIIGHLMKYNEADDPITFKVKTMILPVKNQPNISTPEASNVNVAPKIREKNVQTEAEDRKACYNSPMKNSSAAQCGVDENAHEFFGNNESEVSDGIKNGYKMIIERSESVLKTIRSLSARKLLDRIDRKAFDNEFKGLDYNVSLYKSNRESQCRKKLLTNQTRKYIKRSRDILSGRSLRNLTYLDKISIKDENRIVLLYNNDRHKLWKLLKCLIKFRNKSPSMLRKFENLSHNLQTEKNVEKNHSNAAGYRNKLLSSNPVPNISQDFDVYLCTQVSQENEPTIVNKTGRNDADVSFRSIGSNTNDTQPKHSPHTFERGAMKPSRQDPSQWESVRYLETEGEVLNRQSKRKLASLNQKNKNPEDKSQERSFPEVNAVTQTTSNKFWCSSDRADGVEILKSINCSTIEEKFMLPRWNGLKLRPCLEDNCHILNVFSLHDQNMSRRVLQKSEDGNEASLCCPDFEETREDKKHGESRRRESEEAEALFEAELRTAAANQTKSCCQGDNTNSICTPICDVTSRLRLCAIVKPPNETRGASHYVESDNICCCDGMIKPRNADHESSRKNVSIGDADVRWISTSSQTESIKREPQSLATDQDCGCNPVSQFRSACDRRDTRSSVDIDRGRAVFNKEEKISDNVDSSRPAMNDATVQSSIEDPSSVSLNVPNSLDGESLVLEVKMLNALFSIELKNRHKYRGRSIESAEEQNTCEALEREEHEAKKVCDRVSLSCGSQTSHFNEMQSDSKHKIKVRTGISTSSNPVAVSLPEINEPGEKISSLDCVRCQSISLDTSQSLNNFQNETDIQELKDVTRSKESDSKPEENSTVETEALAIGALISTVDRSLQHITDPIISQKLEDIIEYITHLDQDQSYASKQLCTENVEKNAIEALHECRDEARQESVPLVTEGTKRCQRPYKSLSNLTGMSKSTNDQEAQVNDVEFSRDETESEYSGIDRNAEIMEMESPSTMKEVELVSADEREKLQEIFFHSTSTMNHSYCEIEGVGSNSSCDQNIEERLNVAPSRFENFESSEDYRRPGESNGVDINVFTSTVASQLRELSTEAALRSQIRIQTLISNSRLESERNKNNENDSVMSPRHEAIDDNQQWWLKFVPKSNEWSDVNISRFLNIYRAHSILWDPTHYFYTDEPRRMKAYAIIAKRLNLYGVKERECMKLIESLKNLYAEEKERQATVKRCSRKYSPPPSWYSIFEDITECVTRRLKEFANTGSVQVEPTKPWEACCPRLYNEDIWTPKHFRTNVTDWFLSSQDDQLLCTCKESSGTKSEDVSSTETSCTCDRNSESNSSSGIIQCGGKKASHSSISCCCGTQSSIKLSEQCGVNVTERMSASCKGETPFSSSTARCPSKNRKATDSRIIACCLEEHSDDQRASAEGTCCGDRTDLEDNMSNCKTGEMKFRKKKKQSRNRKLVLSGEKTKKINCGGEPDLQKDSGSSLLCGINDAFESLPCGGERDVNHRSQRQTATCPSKPDVQPESCGIRTFYPCGLRRNPKFCSMRSTTDKNEGSVITSSNSKTSSSSESYDACRSPSDSNTTLVTTSNSSSRDRKSVCSGCASIPERQESDHRLDYLNDPTLCEICAVDRVPIPGAYKNVVQLEDPRIQELDKYCRYKDWDAIYNIRSQVPDEDPPTIHVGEDLLLMKRCIDESSSPTRHNHSPTEAAINLFIDPKSSKARQVSLKHEYRWENDMILKIDQPRHYACEVSRVPGHEPAQLIL